MRMRKSITQEFEYGCGIACYAFVLNISYKEATVHLGKEQSTSRRFWVKDIIKALNEAGLNYFSQHIRLGTRALHYPEGTIALIRRSKHYPVGHYLIRHQNLWMDPWINLTYNKNVAYAKSGFRKRLPGKPMYLIVPITSRDTFTSHDALA